ncbi:MAG: pyridoxamine 5'-phosphate oxidase [Actinobacteria bacterium]|nr:pyridoxamine 5'-phosphate oxidase [Actinomycetota bacterium]MBM3697335.1 pyridoxamine 5'-phosphate oxidase [Actinomycetota bacterium]
MAPLLPHEIAPDPPRILAAWIDEARATAQPQATAMTLATAAADGRPSARMVFVRGWGPVGIDWLTDAASRKARELAVRPHAAGVFYWAGLGRQARVEGPVLLLPDDEVAAYFARRRPETRLAAGAWRQGERLGSRADLHRRLAAVRAAGDGGDAEGVPEGWIGQRLEPRAIEFWQEDPDGLHDRLLAVRGASGWTVERLAP